MIDALASTDWYRAHLEPVIAALGDDFGQLYRRIPPRSVAPIVVASGVDLGTVSRTRRTVALCEHGAGQSYVGVADRAYAGGSNRGKCSLFLCPNQRVADLNLARYPNASAVVVGSPRVDVLRRIERAPRPHVADPTVAISFHWRCKVAPEAGTALDHYVNSLHRLAVDLAAHGVKLVGHAHPRIADELRSLYAKAGIEYVERFEDVVARSDCYVADNSSTIFEMAALDRPVVLLNCPQYRRDVNHGLRFWDEADVGVQVDGPGGLVDGIMWALKDTPSQTTARRAVVRRVYPFAGAGIAANLAADALRSLT